MINCHDCQERDAYGACLHCPKVMNLRHEMETQLDFWHGRRQMKGGDGSQLVYLCSALRKQQTKGEKS